MIHDWTNMVMENVLEYSNIPKAYNIEPSYLWPLRAVWGENLVRFCNRDRHIDYDYLTVQVQFIIVEAIKYDFWGW